MAGIIVPILKKTEFNYTFLDNNSTASVVLHPALNAVPYRSGRLLVRVHRLTMAAGQTVAVGVLGTNPSPEDPQEFTVEPPLMAVIIDGDTSQAGDLGTDTYTDLYPFLKVGIMVEQTTGGTPFFFEISADLVLREE